MVRSDENSAPGVIGPINNNAQGKSNNFLSNIFEFSFERHLFKSPNFKKF